MGKMLNADTFNNLKNMKTEKVNKVCPICHETFMDYECRTTKVCPNCLAGDHYTTCVHCGKTEKYTNGSLISFLQKDYCSITCRDLHERGRGEMMASIYSNLIEPRKHEYYQDAMITPSDIDLEEIIGEQCSSIVLFQLYAELEPYYKECEGGMTFEKYLPSTQQYLLDLLHYIKVINRILRIEPKEKLVGQYADGRTTRYHNQGNWEQGPTESDIKHLETELRK